VLPTTMPRLADKRVILRPFEFSDAPLIATAATDPLIPLITTVPSGGTEADIRAYIERQRERLPSGIGYSFVIADADSDEAVGHIGLWMREIETGRATIGYWVAQPFRRRGYLKAALRVITDWAITLHEVQRLQLFVEPWNEGSWRGAEACGYQREGLLRQWERVGTEHKDMYAYSLIPPPRD
jgi:[ribosomal protein S5]-alanine N-acetyltransferase